MNNRLLFRIPIFYKEKFLGFEYHNIQTGQILTDIKDKTNCENWEFGNWEQCTTHYDKNNNLIYESDIIKDKNNVYYNIFWTEKGLLVQVDGNYMPEFPLTKKWIEAYEIEIISNIHENKNK